MGFIRDIGSIVNKIVSAIFSIIKWIFVKLKLMIYLIFLPYRYMKKEKSRQARLDKLGKNMEDYKDLL